MGRWLRQNVVGTTASNLGQQLRLGVTFVRRQKFYLNPPSSDEDLRKLGELMELDVERLRLMFPPKGESIKLKPTRLCGTCYAGMPCRRMESQFKSTVGCEHHQLRLLSKCPDGKK